MDERKEPTIEPKAARRRTEWVRPEVDRLIAGGAEGSSDLSVDGLDIPS